MSPIVSLRGVSRAFAGGVFAMRDVSLEIGRVERADPMFGDQPVPVSHAQRRMDLGAGRPQAEQIVGLRRREDRGARGALRIAG